MMIAIGSILGASAFVAFSSLHLSIFERLQDRLAYGSPGREGSNGIGLTRLLPRAHKIAAVQRVLTEYGYAQLEPTGVMSADTASAIEKFQRERHLRVDGKISDTLLREIEMAIGGKLN